MFGFRYIKANPSSFLIQFRNGKSVREGRGLSFFYFAPRSSLVLVPMQTTDAPFIFKEVSNDYQEVTIQGQVTFRIIEPEAIAGLIDFTLKPDGSGYVSDEPVKLAQRVVNAVQVQVKSVVQRLPLQEILRLADQLVKAVRENLKSADGLRVLGIEVIELSILAVKPNPDTARALEAKVRETILKEADDAIYTRRNAAIEQERGIKSNELNTEIAVEQKKREIRETQMDAERAVLEKRQLVEREEMEGRVTLEEKKQKLVELATENTKREAAARAYGIEATMKAVAGVDAKVLQALTLGTSDPSVLIALAFQGLADNAQRIGELNISPDLLRQLMVKKG
ncbi:MAG: SPFH domain-containing protein [Betaproteobacteria bacterium]|nr:SPFH domain-containing protein [Betaproteobacteria bacterium]